MSQFVHLTLHYNSISFPQLTLYYSFNKYLPDFYYIPSSVLEGRCSALSFICCLALYRVGQKQVYSCEYSKQFILILLFINYYVILQMNNCKPTLAPFCICLWLIISLDVHGSFVYGNNQKYLYFA